jgi:arylsulfatase A-like enzyme
MDIEATGREEGRDASGLFTGQKPSDWKDIAFLRGTSRHGWLCAVTDNYKLVYSPRGEPWLFDLQNDPNELTNLFSHPDYQDVVQRLTAELANYCRKRNDPSRDHPQIKADMAAVLSAKNR